MAENYIIIKRPKMTTSQFHTLEGWFIKENLIEEFVFAISKLRVVEIGRIYIF